ncbi:GTP-binding protein, partial [Enterococcus hirae]
LSGTKCTAAGIAELPQLRQLRVLKLIRLNLGTDVLARIGKATGLQELRLAGNNLTDASLRALSGLSTIRKLDLRENQLT